jgi:hypothetical protein
LASHEEKEELCIELEEIERDLVRQLLRSYTRGANYEEFWALVDRLLAFSELRRSFCA